MSSLPSSTTQNKLYVDNNAYDYDTLKHILSCTRARKINLL